MTPNLQFVSQSLKAAVLDAGLGEYLKILLPIILGWFLGLLSPLVVEKIRAPKKRGDLLRTIRAELDELRYRLVFFAFKITSHLGTGDRTLFQWILVNLKKYNGISQDENIIDAVEKLSKNTDEELVVMSGRRKATKNISLGLKTFVIPYTESHLGEIDLLKLEQQRRIFEIRTRLHLINEEIHNANYFFRQTFSSNLTEENKNILNVNANSSYNGILAQTRDLVEQINCL